jgi:Family of unknown function (DUF5856)
MKFSVKEAQQANPVADLVMCLLNSVTTAHIMHFQTPSFAEHMALGTFYEEIGDLVDSFVESYQGKYSIIQNYPKTYELPADEPIAYLKALGAELEQYRRQPEFPQDTELQNELDNIANLINGTLYKLRFLN